MDNEFEVEEQPEEDAPLYAGKDAQHWLNLSRDAYRVSDEWFEQSLRKKVEDNLAISQGRHPSGSKYHSDAYKYRSKRFRPKTRAAIRKNEATAAIAFFATADVINIEGKDPNNPMDRMVASINKELVNYRLENTIPWFLTCIGAYQEAQTVGVVISKQHWVVEKESEEIQVAVLDENQMPVMGEDGKPLTETRTNERITRDEPDIQLIPIENLRIHPGADWRDPINSSPFVQELIPMYIGDIKSMMRSGDWIQYEDGVIQGAVRHHEVDGIRRAREGGNRQDPKETRSNVTDFDLAWVRLNIIRDEGKDYVYYTLGESVLLTEPERLPTVFKHGVRPYVMGFSVIETHKVYKDGIADLTRDMQTEINDVANQRLDNVKLAMNKRYFIKRNGNVDINALKRNVPGGGVIMDDLNDVKEITTPDVTSSSYQEQDRLNNDFDEIAGTFSPSSVQSNRAMNDTVGGMNLLTQNSNEMSEYTLRTFVETWYEPTMRQLVMMEQAYETDEEVLAIAGDRSVEFRQYGLDRVEDWMMQGNLNVRVNVGFGASNPEQRLKKIGAGLQMTAQFMPMVMQRMKPDEINSEIWGALGYKDGSRFFEGMDGEEDPQLQAMQQEIERLTQMLESGQMEMQSKERIEGMKVQGKIASDQIKVQGAVQVAHVRGQYDAQLAQLNHQLETVDRYLAAANTEIKRAGLQMQREALRGQLKAIEAKAGEQARLPAPMSKEAEVAGVIARDDYGSIPDAIG